MNKSLDDRVSIRLFGLERARISLILKVHRDRYGSVSHFLRSAIMLLVRIHELNAYDEVVKTLRKKQFGSVKRRAGEVL